MEKNLSEPKMKKKENQKSTLREYMESLFVAMLIAIVIRALVIYPFRIPTGSMEDSLLVGDFLLANKFVYGIRTPDWVGIPYTKIGFKIPFIRTPGFRKPQKGDVVIFKYPRDATLNYIKRCVAVSGDTVEYRNKVLYVNGEVFPNPPHSKFIDSFIYPANRQQSDIYPPGAGNRDNYGPVRVPAPGDTFRFTDENKNLWYERFQIILYEDHRITLSHNNQTIDLTIDNQDRWQTAISMYPMNDFTIDEQSLSGYIYTVKNRHYFMMGDNRDNSLDSRSWGFLPERYVVGEGLIIYWSWNSDVPLYRLFKKIRFGRILNLIR
ncbi:signal peptidase I [bacterium]|nr:signal peptidase I [bacterium]